MAYRTLAAAALLVALAAPASAQSPWCARQLQQLDAMDYQSRRQVQDICKTIDLAQRIALDPDVQERARQEAEAERKARLDSVRPECRKLNACLRIGP